MKKYLILLIILTSLFGKQATGQASDSTVNALLAINESQFVNKPLDSIIAALPPGYIQMKIVGIRKTARHLRVMYPNRVWIDLHVRQFNYMNPVDASEIWNVTLMRKENLNHRVIYKGVKCYAGCPEY